MHQSTMRKTVIFLLFTVIILPSLGLTSLNGFVIYSLTEDNQEYNWSCLFFPDNGVFFMSYIATSTFIGSTVQLLRVPDLAQCLWRLCRAKSEAERLSIRKDLIWDFGFGVQYSYLLLVFTMVTFFSISCPLISIFGVAYFAVQGVVDRHNIFFACMPSRVSHAVHALAVHFVAAAMLLKSLGFAFLMYMRGGRNDVVIASAALVCFNFLVCLTIMTPLRKVWPNVASVAPLKQVKRSYRSSVKKDEEVRERYQPAALRKYVNGGVKPKDDFDNPVGVRVCRLPPPEFKNDESQA